jgi:hypothetical protein
MVIALPIFASARTLPALSANAGPASQTFGLHPHHGRTFPTLKKLKVFPLFFRNFAHGLIDDLWETTV